MVLGRYADPQVRAYYGGHVWMHSDVVYLLANGQLLLEEPELAGVRLSYPWAAHVFQAVVSSLLNESPVFNYSWAMLFCLVCVCVCSQPESYTRLVGTDMLRPQEFCGYVSVSTFSDTR